MILRPARAALREWFRASPDITQASFADALGVSQQTVSGLLGDRQPGRELAEIVEAATGIPWRGWFSERDLRQWEQRVQRARAFRESATAP